MTLNEGQVDCLIADGLENSISQFSWPQEYETVVDISLNISSVLWTDGKQIKAFCLRVLVSPVAAGLS